MFARIRLRLAVWLNHEKPVPASLTRRMGALRLMIRKGGPGSDLAAAEMKGITTTIMELGR